jgi:hypothetical protein
LKTHFLEGNRDKIDQHNGEQIGLQNRVKTFPGIFEERYRGVDEIPGQEKEQRNMEGVNDLVKKGGEGCKVVVTQNYQQNANASCNVKILDSFGHDDVSFI